LLQRNSPGTKPNYPFRKKSSFYGEDLLAPRTNPKLEEQLLLAVREYLFCTFAGSLHFGRRSSNRNLRKRHAAVTYHGLSWLLLYISFFLIHALSFIFLGLLTEHFLFVLGSNLDLLVNSSTCLSLSAL
jgi:hypothetical protein